MTIRVLIAEDHHLTLEAIEQKLDTEQDIHIIGTATHGSELHRKVRETSPDVVVLDLSLSGLISPVTVIEKMRELRAPVEILVLSDDHDSCTWGWRLISAGVRGYVLKTDELSLHLADGVRAIVTGRRFYSSHIVDQFFNDDALNLTDTEIGLLRLVAEGWSNAYIGETVGLAPKTVRNYLYTAFDKLGVTVDEAVSRRVAALNRARGLGLFGNNGNGDGHGPNAC